MIPNQEAKTIYNTFAYKMINVACSFINWYPIFKDITIKSKILTIPDEVLSYLRSDKFFLPKSCNEQFDQECTLRTSISVNSDQIINDFQMWATDSEIVDCDRFDCLSEDEPSLESNDSLKIVDFPDFESQIQRAIDNFHSVFPKLNWKAPILDIFFVIIAVYQHNGYSLNLKQIPILVLRKWTDINRCNEFRCFIRDDNLIAVCQRNIDTVANVDESGVNELEKRIQDFYNVWIFQKFKLQSFIMDIFIEKNGIIKLIDFGVYDRTCSDAILFSWSELDAINKTDDHLVMRFKFGKKSLISCRINQYPLEAASCNIINLAQSAYKLQSKNDDSSEDDNQNNKTIF
ncbi:hypothetical protein GJ496_003867 [Pomphorhynchus laevis]|nr:hypothetical protein GJ496_003867 [Pomphorhynchus laevis]